jgi:RNA polymerase sigma-70 factor (ECF subfamily)
MLRSYPNVRRWEDTDDVLQNATMRLLRSLEHVEPRSVRDFFNFAAVHLRRELLDLARHYRGHGPVARRLPGSQSSSKANAVENRAASADDATEELERWTAFHKEVEKLPVEEREVVGLIFYHGWSHAAVAELFQCTVRTVQRRWKAAMLKLHILLNGAENGELKS